jgi:hypothetical protein
MAQLPTISEILNNRVDPMLDTGEQGVVLDVDKAVDKIFQAATVKQQNDWNKYLQFQKNLQEFYANGAKIAEMDMLPEDRQVIMKKYADWVAQAAEDPTAIFNPLSNPKKYSELIQKGSEIMSLAQKSKQDKAFDMFHREFVRMHPEFNTTTNKAIIASFRETPLEQRKAYSLSNPIPTFDILAMAEEWNKAAAKEETTSRPTGKMVIGADGKPTFEKGDQYITTEIRKYVDPDAYNKYAESAWTKQDKYGNTLADWAKNYIYDPLSAKEKERLAAQGGDPVKNAYMEYVSMLRKPDQKSLKQDENSVWSERLKSQTQKTVARISASARGSSQPTSINPAAFDLWTDIRDAVKAAGNSAGVNIVSGRGGEYINAIIQGRLGPTQKIGFLFDRDTKLRYDEANDKLFVEADVGGQKIEFELIPDDINTRFANDVLKGVSGAGELAVAIQTVQSIREQGKLRQGNRTETTAPRTEVIQKMKEEYQRNQQ